MKLATPSKWFALGAAAMFAIGPVEHAWRMRCSEGQIDENWESVGPIAISPIWAFSFAQLPSHPFLAEYSNRVQLFRNADARTGKLVGEFPLSPNSGGRTYIGVYIARSQNGDPLFLEFVQEHMTRAWQREPTSSDPNFYEARDRIVLDSLELITDESGPSTSAPENLIGHIDGEASPLRFTPARWPSLPKSAAQPGNEADRPPPTGAQ